MFVTRRHLLQGATALAAGGALPAFAQQNYPTRPVTLVVSFPPGGQNDIAARIVAQPMAGYWGSNMVVDNRSGASGAIGAQMVAKANPDGYTLLLLAINHTILPALRASMPYDVNKDFSPVSMVASFPIVLVVNPSLPIHSVQEFIDYAKKNEGKVSFGSSGVGGGEHLAGELFCSQAGVKLLHVPYKGSAPAVTDLVGGQIQAMFCAAPGALAHIKSGSLRAIGISSARRSQVLPDVPTIAEAGVPGYEAGSWVGVVAPAGTPQAVIETINANLRRALDDQGIKERLLELCGEPAPGTPQQFTDFIEAETTKWARTVKQANIEIQ